MESIVDLSSGDDMVAVMVMFVGGEVCLLVVLISAGCSGRWCVGSSSRVSSSPPTPLSRVGQG